MQIFLQERASGKEVIGEFLPESTVNLHEVYLAMYKFDNYMYIGDEAEIKTAPYNQIYIVPLHHILYGKLSINSQSHDVQVGCFISEFNHKFENIVIYQNFESELKEKYCNSISALSGEFGTVILDYESYYRLVNRIGNKPASFKQYVLKSIFSSMYAESDLDIYPNSETSYFNEKDTIKEEDFITIKGMKIYFEEVVKDFYASNI
jgi:hypothetical protein